MVSAIRSTFWASNNNYMLLCVDAHYTTLVRVVVCKGLYLGTGERDSKQ